MDLAVYCASAGGLDEIYHQDAHRLGQLLAQRGHRLVYGGGSVGLMGTLARAARGAGGYVAGYIPERLMAIEGRAFDIADELVVTDTMQARKQGIFSRVDGFLVLPGGMGTMEEFLEVATLRKLGYHDLPIVLLNTNEYWNPLLQFLTLSEAKGFSSGLDRLFRTAATPEDALGLVEAMASPRDRTTAVARQPS